MNIEPPPNIIAIIPARGGSKGIPKKNIIDFCGKPLIAWSIEAALGSKFINDVYVTTDNNEIAMVAQKYGAGIIRRPAELATDTSSSEEAIVHAVSELEKKGAIDAIVFLQATSPLRERDDLDNAIEELYSKQADSLFSATILEDFCIWGKEDDSLKSITFDYKNRGRRQERKPCYLENGSIYIFKPDILKQYNNRLGGNITFYAMPLWKSYEIDNIEDLETCEYYMQKKILKTSSSELVIENTELIVYDFDGVMTDNKVVLREDGIESVVVNRADGLAIGIIKQHGIKQIILTKEKNMVVETRAAKLGIPVIRGVDNKKEVLTSYCKEYNIQFSNVVYIGNDINDLDVMRSVGYPICPADAYIEVKKIARIILDVQGGSGVVRGLLKYIKLLT